MRSPGVLQRRNAPLLYQYYRTLFGTGVKALQKASTCPSASSVGTRTGMRTDPKVVFDWYSNWAASKGEKGVVLAYATMYSHTQRTTDYIARKLSENGIRDIRVFNVSNTHPLSFSGNMEIQRTGAGFLLLTRACIPTCTTSAMRLRSCSRARKSFSLWRLFLERRRTEAPATLCTEYAGTSSMGTPESGN